MTAEFVAMLCVVRYSRINKSGLFRRFSAPNWVEIKRLLLLGLPIGLAIFFEMAIFSVLTLLVGRIGIEAVAAHQIASNVGGITFMIPLALGMAATIRVGYNVGRGDYVAARRSGLLAIGLSLLFAACAAAVLFGFRSEIVALYTQDAQVLATASGLLLFIVLYQPFDDTQVTAIGALRGFKDTRFPMIVALVCYWGVALPIGVGLGFGLFGMPKLGVSGFWWALVAGLTLASIVLLARFQWLSRRADVIAAMAKR
jgi:MATE family multidrug resistance protein